MEWYLYPVLIFAGILCGFINTIAGSGSLITLPILMFIGLPANVANGTNRIGILLQHAVGAVSFRKKKIYEYSEGLWFALPATTGSVIGAVAAVNLNIRVMEQIIGFLLLIMFFIVLYKPEKWLNEHTGRLEGRPKSLQIIIFFFIGLWGGFIQAGVGFLLLGSLVLGVGVNLTKANALKVFIITAFTIVALLVFIINKQVNYIAGFVLAFGSMIGAYGASKFALKNGPGIIRIILLVIILISALKYTGLLDLISRIMI